jgi:hypothetical protein
MGKKELLAAAFVVVAVAGILVYWLHRVPQPPDCSFSGWKRAVGVELDAQVKDLDAIKAKIGIGDSQVRDYDTLMKNYALKYDAACQDVRAQPSRMTQAEYTCLRRNMDKVLDQLQSFVHAVEAAKSVTDATTQREIILRSLDDLQAASLAGYRSGCASAMDVNPKKLSFTGNIPERSVQITNAGNSDFNYSITGLPEAFDPKPITGSVAKGTSVSVAILRTILPVPVPPIKFRIHTNLQDDAEVEISLDAANLAIWQNLSEQARKSAAQKGALVSMQDALEAVNSAIDPTSRPSEPDQLVLASNVLFELHADSEAQKALDLAVSRDPQLAKRPATLILAGLIANRRDNSDQALRFFTRVASSDSPNEATEKGLSDLFAGSVMFAKGNTHQADAVFKEPELQNTVGKNPSLVTFSEKEFCPRTCVAKLPEHLGPSQ